MHGVSKTAYNQNPFKHYFTYAEFSFLWHKYIQIQCIYYRVSTLYQEKRCPTSAGISNKGLQLFFSLESINYWYF